jgi:hypothetical protein
MRHHFYTFLCCLVLTIGQTKNLFAQVQLIVSLTNTATEAFNLSEIQSLKFLGQTLKIQLNNGSISTWNISEISNYRFEGDVGIIEEKHSVGKLKVFPNPVIEQTRIFFSTQGSQHIRIELLDILGRAVTEIYNGYHEGEQYYIWQSDLPKGLYLLRLVAENGQLTQTVLLQ